MAASGIVAGSMKMVGITKAMELVGFTAEERKRMTLYQKVRRRAQRLSVVDLSKSTPASTTIVVDGGMASAQSSLTSNSRNSRNANSSSVETTRTGNDDSSFIGNEAEPLSVRRRLLVEVDDASQTEGTGTPEPALTPATETIKVCRRTSKELQRYNAKRAAQKSRNSQAMKVATRLVEENNKLPKQDVQKRSISEIVSSTNKLFSSNISDKTVARYVRKGLIGTSPLKRGPIGDLPTPIYTALKGAFATYLKLEQSGSKKQWLGVQLQSTKVATPQLSFVDPMLLGIHFRHTSN